MRWLFRQSMHCLECGSRVTFKAVPKRTLSDQLNMYYYLHCSAGYLRTQEICTCKRQFNAKKQGVDLEGDILERLSSFRWRTFFSDEKHQKLLMQKNTDVLRKETMLIEKLKNQTKQLKIIYLRGKQSQSY